MARSGLPVDRDVRQTRHRGPAAEHHMEHPMSAPAPAPPTGSDHERPPRRLLRRRRGRMLGGVALGLADYLNVDVAVVRVVFVVAAFVPFFGFGVLAYLALLVLVPTAERVGVAEGDGAAARPANASDRGVGFWLGLALVALAGSWLLAGIGPSWRPGGGFLVPLLLIGLGIALWVDADRRRSAGTDEPVPVGPSGTRGTPGTSGTPGAPTAPTAATPGTAIVTSDPSDLDGAGGAWLSDDASSTDTVRVERVEREPGAAAPDATDGTSSDGGDTPPPVPPAPPTPRNAGFTPPPVPERRRSPLGRVTLALALLVSGALWLLDQTGAVTVPSTMILAGGVLVIGLGLLVGAFVGRARWLAVVGLLLVPVLLLGTMLRSLDLPLDAGFGDRALTVQSAADVRDTVELGVGTIHVDLSELTDTAVTLPVRIGAGEVIVIVPDDAGLLGTVRSEAGELDLLGSQTVGVGPERELAVAAADGAPTITLDVRIGAGRIVVARASQAEWYGISPGWRDGRGWNDDRDGGPSWRSGPTDPLTDDAQPLPGQDEVLDDDLDPLEGGGVTDPDADVAPDDVESDGSAAGATRSLHNLEVTR
ncbi:PspC domain-containing protein [Nitriliruptoraceae bacterium ZYF776]|nr:PspC domain-containing protein [Profundirhabdus halotolerans]